MNLEEYNIKKAVKEIGESRGVTVRCTCERTYDVRDSRTRVIKSPYKWENDKEVTNPNDGIAIEHVKYVRDPNCPIHKR